MRWLQRLGLLAVLVGAFALRSEGIRWPKLAHPDEPVIVKWIKGGGPSRVYAGGFFVLLRPVRAACEWGGGVSERFRYHTGEVEDAIPDVRLDLFMLARWFNVWLGAFSCLFVFLLARRITGSGWGGLLAAALLAGSHYPVEHSHYAETDVAMLFTLTVGLWLWAEMTATDRRRWLIAAALALGFAAGTKFLLLAILPPFLLQVAVGFRRNAGGGAARAGWAALAAGCLAVGFLLANPGLPGMENVAGQVAGERSRLALETARNMGELAGKPGARWLSHLLWLGRFGLSLGWGWLLLCAAALPLLFLKPLRRHGALLAGVPVLLLVVWVFFAPWVRSQEFMAYLPALAVYAAVAVGWMWGRGRAGWRLAGAGLALLAVAACAVEGLRTASVFGWTDTRVLAGRWLTRHGPAETGYMMEWYASVDAPGFLVKGGERKIEEAGVDAVVSRGAGYLVRNRSYESRGTLNPLTGRRVPAFEEKRRDFEGKAEPLKAWSSARFPSAFSRSRTSSGFTLANSQDLALYGLRVFPAGPDFNVSLSRPAGISGAGRESFCPGGAGLGGDTILQLDRGVREFAIGGPVEDIDPAYLVVYTRERPVSLEVSGYGARQRVCLNPYDVRLVVLHRPAWMVRLSQWEKVVVRTDPGRDSIGRIPCFLRVAFSGEDVFRCLDDMGFADYFERLWPAGVEAGLSPASAARAALGAGDLARSGPELDRAVDEWSRLRAAAGHGEPFRIRGLSAHYHRAFARMRLDDRIVVLEDPEAGRVQPPQFEARLPLHVECPAGSCRLKVEWRVERPGEWNDRPIHFEVLDGGQGIRLGMFSLPPARDGGFTPVLMDFRGEPGQRLDVVFRSAEPLWMAMRHVVVEWTLEDMMSAAWRRLRLDQAECLVRTGKPGETKQALADVDGEGGRPAERIRKARLAFEAACAGEAVDPAGKLEAARRLLSLAPAHWGALCVVAGVEPAVKQRLPAVPDLPNLPVQPEFEPYLRLVGLAAEGERLRGVFEALRDDVPPLAVRVETRRRGKWKKIQDPVPLVRSGSTLSRGERVGFEFEQSSKGRWDDVSLSVESLVEWHPGRLAVAGFDDGRVKLGGLIAR